LATFNLFATQRTVVVTWSTVAATTTLTIGTTTLARAATTLLPIAATTLISVAAWRSALVARATARSLGHGVGVTS
jgi:hypothetical protein